MTLTSPITISKLKTTFGTSYNKIGQICAYANINMWSKYKPFRSSSLSFASISSRDSALASANQALAMGSTYASPAACLAAAKSLGAGGSSWTYLRPRGLSYSEWYRLLDFDGYNHSAVAPMQFGFAYDSYVSNENLAVIENAVFDLRKVDFGELSSYNHLGLVIQKSGGTAMATSWNYDTFIKSIPLSGLADGNYECALFFSNTNLGSVWGSASQQGSYILIPYPYKTFNLSGVAFSIRGRDVISTSSAFKFTIYITSTRARTINQLFIRYRKTGNYSYNSPLGRYVLGLRAAGEQDIEIGDVSDIVSYSEQVSFTSIDNITDPAPQNGNFFAEYSYNNVAYTTLLSLPHIGE